MRLVDIAIIGAGMRGLWLSAELAKLGWTVTWIQAKTPETSHLKSGFEYDDFPWQVGPKQLHSKLVQLSEKYISKVIAPETQDLSVQVMTKKGPLELSGGLESHGLSSFFPETFEELEKYLDSVRRAAKLGEKKGSQLVSAHVKKVFDQPLGRRWAFEWLGSLRCPRHVTSREWLTKWNGEVFDPASALWISKDGLHEIVERGIDWAEKHGVVVHRNARLVGVDVEGKQASGIVFDRAEGFMRAKRIIFSCSYQTIQNKFPKFALEVQNPLKASASALVWVRCGFFLKPGSKPFGLSDFSSFVLDPLMPLINENSGLLRWKSFERGDSLTVWTRVNVNDLKRRSFLEELQKSIRSALDGFFPWFSSQVVTSLPFEDYLLAHHFTHDDLAFVFSPQNDFKPQTTRLKNVYLAGPEFDRGLELLSQMATEMRLLEKLAQIRLKELPRDRTIHPPRNGQGLVSPK